MNKTITMLLLSSLLAGCETADKGPMLMRNYADVSVQDVPQCKNKRLVYAADGSLWIK